MIKKNKVLTRLLLLGVIAIYGTIAYRSYANKKMTEEQSQLVVNDLAFSPANYKKDVYTIDFDLTDPFRGGRVKPRSRAVESPDLNAVNTPYSRSGRNPQMIVPTMPKTVNWPKVQYFGFVKKVSAEKRRCLLSIDGQLVKQEAGTTHREVVIEKVYRDSVILLFEGETKTFLKQ